MLDLTIATNCIRIMKEYGTYRGQKIGRIDSPSYRFPLHQNGQIVLFKEDLFPSDSELR